MPGKILEDAKICLSLLTRLPIKTPAAIDPSLISKEEVHQRIGKAYRAAPIVGLMSGLIGAIAYFAANSLPGNPIYLAAVIAVTAQLMLSGGSQEIGFAKVLELGKHPSADIEGRDEMAAIAAGAIGAGLVVLIKIFMIGELAQPLLASAALIASAAFGRAAQVQLMAFTPSESKAMPSKVDATTSMVVGAIIGVGALIMVTGVKFILPLLGAVAGSTICLIAFFALTQSRKHLDDIHVREAVSIVVELGSLLGIIIFTPFDL